MVTKIYHKIYLLILNFIKMKKFILTMIIALMMVFSANAQIATENSKFFDNTYVGVGVGATTERYLRKPKIFPSLQMRDKTLTK